MMKRGIEDNNQIISEINKEKEEISLHVALYKKIVEQYNQQMHKCCELGEALTKYTT